MIKRKLLIFALILVAFVAFTSVTFAAVVEHVVSASLTQYKVLSLTWTANSASFVAPYTTTNIVDGYVSRIVTVPSSTTPPTPNYDVRLLDYTTDDITGGLLYNRSNTATEHITPKLFDDGTDRVYGAVLVKGKLTLIITGNTTPNASGTIYIFIER